MDKTISYILLLGNILLLVTGQILFKIGLGRSGGLHWGSLRPPRRSSEGLRCTA